MSLWLFFAFFRKFTGPRVNGRNKRCVYYLNIFFDCFFALCCLCVLLCFLKAVFPPRVCLRIYGSGMARETGVIPIPINTILGDLAICGWLWFSTPWSGRIRMGIFRLWPNRGDMTPMHCVLFLSFRKGFYGMMENRLPQRMWYSPSNISRSIPTSGCR